MTGAFNEFQRKFIVKNTWAGLDTARMRGRKGGRPDLITKDRIRSAEAILKDNENYDISSILSNNSV